MRAQEPSAPPLKSPAKGPPVFDAAFRKALWELFAWRRDVRRFRRDPVPEDVLKKALAVFPLAPSVGLSQPWRLVLARSGEARAAALASFHAENARALAGYEGERRRLYATLKLSGMEEAPVQLAVFCDEATLKGAGLGAKTMPETKAYSVVAAITLFWLALRVEGLGMGWVSILEPSAIARALKVPPSWRLVAWLCIGYPETVDAQPELALLGWEERAETVPLLER